MLKYLSLLGRLFSSPSARNSEGEERSSGNSIYKSTAEREATETAVMAAELIEISSSDNSDYFELSEDEYPSDDSTNHGPIPSWADSAAPLSTAIDGPSQMSTSQLSTVNRIASNLGRQGYSGRSLTDHGRTSVKAPSQTSAPIGSSSNGNHVPREMLSFRGLPIAKRSGPPPVGSSSNGNHVPNEMLYFRGLPIGKRSGPPPVGPRLTEGDFIRTLNSSQMRETFARSYSAQSIPTLGRVSDNENGSGVSNQPTKQRIVSSAAQHTTSADPGFHIQVGEERFGEYDERLIYQAALQDLNQPKAEATLPDGLLSVSLLRHQKIALAWMLQKEKSCCCTGGFLADDQGLGKTISMIALIQFQKLMQSRSKSKDVSHQITNALNLDDDEEENGATALQGSKQDEDSHDLILIPEASASTCNFQAKRPQAGTLVVCPASVLRQWARELEEKVADEARLDVLIYHGSNRTKDPIALAKYDVVLTTYTIVANEVPPITSGDVEEQNKKSREKYSLISDFSGNKKRKKATHASKRKKKAKKGTGNSSIDSDCGTIAKVRWLRVILDEAQIIKNHRTLGARACAGIKAKSRWCLSGTPIQNTIDDLFSYFRFLKYEPYTSYPSFCSKLKDFISRDSVQGYKKLYAVLRAVMLRRTKDTFIDGEPIIRLPAKTINLSQAEFSEEERDFYKKLAANSLSQFKAYAAAGTVNQNYANILLMLLRLRQACDHPLLVKGVSSDVIRKESMETAKNLSRESLIDLMKHLDTSSAICLVCHDPPEDAIVTLCGHVFCYQCVSEYLMGDENTCPVPECKEQLGSEYVFSKATLRSCLGDDHLDESLPSEPEKSLVLQDGYSSSKIKIALEILQSHCRSNNPYSQVHAIAGPGDISTSLKKETFDSVGSVVKATNVTASSDSHTEGPKKAIVFSQWTGMLDLMEVALNQTALKYRRLDGGMKLSARDKAVKEFNNNPEVTVMLMSLKAGNLGLNMVAATHVILLDLWWNPTTEDQAIDRAHRIGQTQPVTVSRLSIKDTVEERILALQEQKREMVASAFGEDQSGGSGARLTAKDLEFLFMGSRR